MSLGGRRRAVQVEVPEAEAHWCYVQARAAREPLEAIPLDRSEAHETGRVRLFLPPDGDVVIQVFGADGDLLRTAAYR